MIDAPSLPREPYVSAEERRNQFVFPKVPPTIGRALTGGAQRIVGIFGPVATGKSVAVCVYVYLHCKKYAALVPGQTIRWVFVRDTYESVRATTLKTWRLTIPDPMLGTWNEQRKTYTIRLPKGQRAEVEFMGLDKEADLKNLLSKDLTGFVLEEPAGGVDKNGQVMAGIPEVVYTGLLGRRRHPATLGLRHKRAIVVGNPGSLAHWTNRLIRQRALAEPDLVACVDVPNSESPLLYVRDPNTGELANPNYYEDLEREYGVGTPNARRYVHGEWLPALAGGFTWAMIPEVRQTELKPFVRIVATLDPATGSKQGDYSALVVAGIEADFSATVLDLRVGRFDGREIVAQIYDVVVRRRPTVVGIESVNFQSWIETMLQQERERTGSPYREVVVPAHMLPRDSRISKEQRIQNALGFRLAEGRLKRLAGLDPAALGLWQKELEAFPEGEHDDVLDALADLDQVQMIGGAPHLALLGTKPAVTQEERDAEAEVRRRESTEMVLRAVQTQGVYWPQPAGRR